MMEQKELVEILLDHKDIEEIFRVNSRKIRIVELIDDIDGTSDEELDREQDFRKIIRIIIEK